MSGEFVPIRYLLVNKKIRCFFLRNTRPYNSWSIDLNFWIVFEIMIFERHVDDGWWVWAKSEFEIIICEKNEHVNRAPARCRAARSGNPQKSSLEKTQARERPDGLIEVVFLNKLNRGRNSNMRATEICSLMGIIFLFYWKISWISGHTFGTPIHGCRVDRRLWFWAIWRYNGSGKHGCKFPRPRCNCLMLRRFDLLDIRYRGP